MTQASIIEALAGGLGDENSYLAQDPIFNAGVGVSKWQLPRASNNAEAIIGPALQGLLAGGLTEYGRKDAAQNAYDDYRTNPLIKALSASENIGPVASGSDYASELLHAYSMPDAPDGWTTKIGKSDLLLGALAKQQAVEKQQKNDDLKAQLDNQVSLATNPAVMAAKVSEANQIEQGKVAAQSQQLHDLLKNGADNKNIDAEIALLPKSVQSQALKEKSGLDAVTKTKDLVNQAFQEIEDLNKGGASWFAKNNPLSDTYSTFSTDQGNIAQSLQDLAKTTRIPSPILQALLAKVPKSYQSNSQIEIERQQLLDSLDSRSTPTPLLKGLGLVPGDAAASNSAGSGSNPPPGAIPTGKTSGGKPVYSVNGSFWVAD